MSTGNPAAITADPNDGFDSPLGGSLKGLRRFGDDFTRDAKGTPHVACPTGAQVKTGPRKGLPKLLKYGRPSGLNKQIESSYQLQKWAERQIIYGLSLPDDQLTAKLVALAELERDSNEAKDLADGIVVRAKDLAKASIAADRGTHIHAVTEDIDLDRSWVDRAADGEALGLDGHVQAAMLNAWDAALLAYDLEVLAVEARVVHDGWRQAGTLDRIVRLARDITFANGVTLPADTVVLLDVKTGKWRPDFWHAYAVQCKVYAAATPYDTATDTRGGWPWPVDQNWAIIAHLPVDEALSGRAVCRFVLVDIASAGTIIDQVIMPAKQWAARRDLFALAHGEEPQVAYDIAMPTDRSIRHDFGLVAEPPAPRPAVVDEGELVNADQVAELKRRAADLDPQARALLDTLAKAAKEADRPFSIGAGPTRRRWHIYRALLRLAGRFGAELEADHVRATLALVIPDAAQPAVELGPAIGSLTTDEAMRFVQAANAVIAQKPAIQIADDATPHWVGVALPTA